ncbi:hypothetical protein [Streptomyces pinistramenti]|uniref:hypothetical protein n=1 Tax=Streptomyces pinistramenti TaxID=2884812 RepID=UPI001D0993BB|nr:hypothetical protein [Streptomyces pinistramenti]MCB5906947.1 hypothetical protein [Streptomyces pinistramenti]
MSPSPTPDEDPTKAPVYGARGASNNATIEVDAQLLRVFGAQIGGPDGAGGLIENLSTQVGTIFHVLGDLKLGWAGQTQQEAEDFFTRLDACMTSIFGKADNEASQGNSVLARVAVGLTAAGNNYLTAEDTVVKEFTDFATQIGGGSGGEGGGGGSQSITDPKVTAISETFGR